MLNTHKCDSRKMSQQIVLFNFDKFMDQYNSNGYPMVETHKAGSGTSINDSTLPETADNL